MSMSVMAAEGLITNYGLYSVANGGIAYRHPGSTAGRAAGGVEAVHIEKTTSVPLRKGIMFGFEWEAEGFPPNMPVIITYRVKHPPALKPDGQVSTGFDEPFYVLPQGITLKTADYYMLSEDWELLPGEWTISVLYEDTVIVEKTFTVAEEHSEDSSPL